MVGSILRSIGSIALSLVLVLVLLIAVEGASAVLHPFPAGFDGSREAMVEHVARYPDWVLALAAAAWGLTAFISTWLATRLGTGRHPAHGITIGSLLLLAVIFNMYLLPYPLWFELLNLVVFPAATYCGVKLGREKKNPWPAADTPSQQRPPGQVY